MKERTVVVASSDRLIAEAAAAYLNARKSWRVIGTADDGVQAVAVTARMSPACVLVPGPLTRIGPATVARKIRRRSPDATVVILGNVDAPDAVVLPPDADADAVLAALGSTPARYARVDAAEGRGGLELLKSLTKQERTVLLLLAKGASMREVASRLSVSEHTIRTHMQNLYAKLGCHSRLEVEHFAARHGLVRFEADDR